MYAVTGASGKVGGAAALALIEAGRPVRVVLRDRNKAKLWEERGCEVAIAELTDVDALAAAFEGAEGVFAMKPSIFDPTPGFPEAERYSKAMEAALLKAKPKKVVALSTIGADQERPNLLNQLRDMEKAMASLPMPVTFLRAAWFMENAALDVVSASELGVIQSYLQPADRKVAMIATKDVGRAAAQLLQEDWTGVRAVELESKQRVSPNDIAGAFSKALGRDVAVKTVAREAWEQIFLSQGMKNPTPRMQMVDGFNGGWINFPGDGVPIQKGSVGIDEVIAGLVKPAR
jgi:uncharacterized protein YbjT (DUF2867 family)